MSEMFILEQTASSPASSYLFPAESFINFDP
jgi:hypothetical protein